MPPPLPKSTTSPIPPTPKASNSSLAVQKCHYTLNAYVCTHKTWPSSCPPSFNTSTSPSSPSPSSPSASKTPRIIHSPPCPFSSPILSRTKNSTQNSNILRCFNMEKTPRIQQIPQLCPKCRPFTLGVGRGGKGIREFEIEVPFEGQLKIEKGSEGAADLKVKVQDEDADGNGSIQSKGDESKSKLKASRLEPEPLIIPSSENGSPEFPPPSFSIFKRVLGALIPGSSASPPTDTPVQVIDDETTSENENEGTLTIEGTKQDVKGKSKDKKSWHQVEHGPEWEIPGWEIVGREKS
ncbi:hypothetical protein ONS95_006615 [Cadophora gregata]|uniref:uncharacterized protein n=1 Tax=Cadophora gregata TaxID=51156 RepID=UPI0026DDC017|nr:uncharacterized protein ONS95_006615 [Cadophora gregata]KAK0101442.1 hypothetical protein ONS95_006615 [Cadophora gregata]KAK0106547.1 hypothetical protein ONS96_004168 [Cadophora gregata f. sp. sojae]